MPNIKRTKAEERAHTELILLLSENDLWMRAFRLKDAFIPAAWAEMDQIAPTEPPRVEVTLDLDADMVKWFRGLGSGWEGRLNSVLRSYMLAVVSREIESRRDRDWRGEPI
ncbi:MAG: BrnA antitoxin family protein [Pseudomonadota bacterium]